MEAFGLPAPTGRAEELIALGESLVSARAGARDEDYLLADWSGCQIRAEFLEQLARSGRPLDVEGAEILGSLDLSNTTLTAGLRLRRCLFREQLDLTRTTVPDVNLNGSRIARLRAGYLSTDTLRFGDRGVAGRIHLAAATLGRLSLRGLLLEGEAPKRLVLDANVLTTSRSADLGGGFEAHGRVRFIGASIGGQLSFRNAVLHDGLYLHEVSTTRALYLRQGVFNGQVTLTEAWIKGKLDARDATLTADGADALTLSGTTIERTADLSGVVVDGSITIKNSNLNGSLRLSQAAVRAPSRPSVDAEGSGAAARSEADLSLNLLDQLSEHRRRRYGEIAAEDWEEPATGRLGIDADDTTETAGLRIQDSRIGGDLVLSTAAVTGGVVISGTSVTNSVDLRWSHLTHPGRTALSLSESTVGATLRLRQGSSFSGKLDLSGLTVARLDDDPALWEAAKSYDLRGLTYQSIPLDGPLWSVKARLAWLSRQTPYSPQPYEQFAGLLTRIGRRDDAWRVLQAEHDARRRRGDLSPLRTLANWVSGLILGHGYRPERAFIVLVLLSFLGWPVYETGWRSGAFRAADTHVAVHGRCTTGGDCFNPWLFSVNKSLPFLALDSQKAWKLDDRVGPYGTAADVHVAVGWILATAGVAGLTRRAVKS